MVWELQSERLLGCFGAQSMGCCVLLWIWVWSTKFFVLGMGLSPGLIGACLWVVLGCQSLGTQPGLLSLGSLLSAEKDCCIVAEMALLKLYLCNSLWQTYNGMKVCYIIVLFPRAILVSGFFCRCNCSLYTRKPSDFLPVSIITCLFLAWEQERAVSQFERSLSCCPKIIKKCSYLNAYRSFRLLQGFWLTKSESGTSGISSPCVISHSVIASLLS